MARHLILLLAASLAVGLLISLLQGVAPHDLAAALYVLTMGLVPFLFSLAVLAAAAGLYWLIRRRRLPYGRLTLWSALVLGNLLLLLDQHLAH
ncbi:MAG TPA: hypothetical protein VGH91_11660 [Gammaproteobacteria bacterium]|jgi:hypothetical protein